MHVFLYEPIERLSTELLLIIVSFFCVRIVCWMCTAYMSLILLLSCCCPNMYVLCLHADKAKGLQINLSQALQGKSPGALFCFHSRFVWLTGGLVPATPPVPLSLPATLWSIYYTCMIKKCTFTCLLYLLSAFLLYLFGVSNLNWWFN